MKRQSPEQKFLSYKREKRRLKAIENERIRRMELAKRANRLLIYPPQTLHILQKKIPRNISRAGKSKSETIHIPETFSIVDDTEGALRKIYELVALSNRRRPPKDIFFDHSSLINFDLAAEEILDVVTLEFKTARRRTKGGLRLRGRLPIDPGANRFIRAVGIPQHLELIPSDLRSEEKQGLRTLRFQSYKALLRAFEESPSERAARNLVDYFNSCLTVIGRQLSEHGRHRLSLYAGEVLDNAVEHSGTQDWVLVGYLDLNTPERSCEISIFNFGKSFAETFSALPAEHFTRQYVDPFVDIHKKKGLFQHGWEPDNLLSVIALQGQVSSKNQSDQDTRGSGTIDLIQFFQDVHAETQGKGTQSAKMVIVSGRTRMLFNGKYTMAPSLDGRQIIAFNSANNLEVPPDRAYVECLKGLEFPGTIVSIRFPLPKAATRFAVEKDEY